MIFLLVLLLAVPLYAEPLDDVQARFGIVTGDVGLLTQGAKDWIVPHDGLPIEPGDQVRTGEDGRVELLLSENAVWMLEPESDLSAEHMDTNTGRFNLSSGTLMGLVDSERVAGTVQRWEFNTPSAMAAVHGTEFILECGKKEGTRLGVFAGSVDLEPAETAEGLQPPVDVAAGYEAVVKRAKPIQLSPKVSSRMKAWAAALPAFRRRQRQIQNTWSPFTPTTRQEARKRFVSPPLKTHPKPPRPPRLKYKVPVEN